METFEAILLVVCLVLFVIVALIIRSKMSSKAFSGGATAEVEMFIQEPWYSLIQEGTKEVEGRAARRGRWGKHIGDTLVIRTHPKSRDAIRAKITDVRHYDNLDDYLDAEWMRAAPHCSSRAEARDAYLAIMMNKGTTQVFGEERIRERGGMEAVELEVMN